MLAFATGRLIKGFLYEVKPLDASTYVGVAVVLTAIGLVAAFIPARQGSIDSADAGAAGGVVKTVISGQ